MTIEWNPSKLGTGVPTVDAEHEEWIRRFNDFDDALTTGRGMEVIQQFLDYMMEYSETHFVHEELLVEGIDTPATRRNRSEHNKFRENIAEIRHWIKENGASSVEIVSIKLDLQEWLVNHICFVDRQVFTVPA